MPWEPILDGPLAERAWEVLRDIARGLAGHDEPTPDLALFWSYASSVLDDAETARHADAALERIAPSLERGVPDLALYGGLAGIGWITAHIAQEADDVLEVIDASLIDALSSTPRWEGQHDLITGLAGIAVYFLERRAAPTAAPALRLIVEHFAKLAEHDDVGTTWFTPPALLSEFHRRYHPDGYYNCSLAHGVASIVAVLARIADRSDAPPEAAVLRDGASRWLLGQYLGDAGFPALIDRRAAPGGARTAWCYGDPGVTIALWRSDVDVEPAIRRWLNRTDTGVVDACICHGAAGLAHICNRLYHATRDVTYREVARTWIERTLAYQRPTEGIGGFLTHFPAVGSASELWRTTPDFLDGAAGIGLVLLAALTPLEPEWDRLILCDLPVM